MDYAPTIFTTFGLIALACHAVPPDSPEPARELPRLPSLANPEAAAILPDQPVLVRPRTIGAAATWRFDPNSNRVAALDDLGCGVWQRSGEYLGAAPISTCQDWQPTKSIEWSVDQLLVGPGDRRVELRLEGDRFEVQGTALRGQTKGDYVAAAFGPDGDLALAVHRASGDLQVEIWTGRGKRERVLDLEVGELLEYSDIEGVWLGWSDDSLHALVDLSDGSDDRSIVAVSLPKLDGVPLMREFPGLYDGDDAEDPQVTGSIDDVWLSPDEATLFVGYTWLIPDQGPDQYEVAVSLDTLGDTALQSNADPEAWGPSGAQLEEDVMADAKAVEESERVKWGSAVGSAGWSSPGSPYSWVIRGGWNWELTSLTRIPDAGIELVYSEGFVESSDPNWKIVAAGRKGVLTSTTQCVEDECASSEPVGCRLIDASWSFTQLLFACGDEWRISATPEPGQVIVLESMTTLTGGTANGRARWGPKGLALFSTNEGLRVFAGDDLLVTHDVDRLLAARLDEELDLALVHTSAGPRVVDLATGELGQALAWTQRIVQAAFGPDRQLIALAGGGELAVFDRDQPAPLFHMQAGTLAGLAFRQDGAALYIGIERAVPELALDPRTGARLDGAQLDRGLLSRLAAASLDPSWRWAIEADRTLIRTLDGQALIWPYPIQHPDTMILESGWFCGSREALREYRLHIGPGSPAPVVVLPDAFERPDLRREFLDGARIPAPRISTAD